MKNYFTLLIIVVLSTVLSFINQIIYAKYFGASTEFDILNAVLSLPLSLIGTLTGAIALILMPLLNEYELNYGKCEEYLIHFLKKYYLYIGIASIIIPFIQILIIYNKIDHAFQNKFVYLSLLTGIFTMIYILNNIFIVFFNYRKKYILASINNSIVYLLNIILCIIFAPTLGIDIAIYSLILGNLFMLLIYLYNLSYLYKIMKFKKFKIQVTTKQFLGGIFILLPYTIPSFIDAYFLVTQTGQLSYVSYANKLMVVLLVLIMKPIDYLFFPKILEVDLKKETRKFVKIIIKTFLAIFLFFIVAFFASKLFFLDLMSIFFEHGKFTSTDSQNIYMVFNYYILGLLALMLMSIVSKVQTKMKLFNEQISLSIFFLVIYILLMNIFVDKYGYIVVGIIYAVSWNIIGMLSIINIYYRIKKI